MILLIIVSCNNAKNEVGTPVASDSSITVTPDSNSVAGVKADEYPEGLTLEEIREDYVKMYYTQLNIDTSFLFDSDTIRFRFQYHCKMDSAVTVPKNYVEMYGLENFVTHNFTSSVLITQDQQTILKREINKNDFDKLLEDHLKEYAVLFVPTIHYSADSIAIHYSISIPLTDVGIGVTATIKPGWTISFGRN